MELTISLRVWVVMEGDYDGASPLSLHVTKEEAEAALASIFLPPRDEFGFRPKGVNLWVEGPFPLVVTPDP